MSLPRTTSAFEDVRVVLDLALDHHGGTYRLATAGAAVRWRQRAYTFRKLLREQRLEASVSPGFDPGTPYDKLVLTLDEEVVRIGFAEMKGTFEGNSPPEPGVLPEPHAGIDLDLSLEIAALREKIIRGGQDE